MPKRYLDIATGAVGSKRDIPAQRRLGLEEDEAARLMVEGDPRRRVVWFEAHRAQLELERRLPGQEVD